MVVVELAVNRWRSLVAARNFPYLIQKLTFTCIENDNYFFPTATMLQIFWFHSSTIRHKLLITITTATCCFDMNS